MSEYNIVSEPMRQAGLSAYEQFSESEPDYFLVEKIYIAMWLAMRVEDRKTCPDEGGSIGEA